MTLIGFWVSIISLLFLSALIEKRIGQHFSFKIFRLVLFPGILFHELSHALIAVLFGGRVVKINLFTEKGGAVYFQRKGKSRLINFFIAFAPLILAILIFYLISRGLQVDLSPATYSFSLILKNINWWSGWTWLYFWVLLSISATIFPSKEDFSFGWPGLLIVFLVALTIYLFWSKADIFYASITSVIIFGILLNIFLLIILETIILLRNKIRILRPKN